MSPELRLKRGAPDSLCNALSAQAPPWPLSGGRCWLRGSVPSPPVCHISAAGRPGVARGVRRAASVTGHWPRGWRHQEKQSNQAQAGERGLPGPSRGLGSSSANPRVSPPSGLGGGSEFSPPPHPRPTPSRSRQPGSRDALAASPQWSPQPVLNLNDSCPQPSQLQLIPEASRGLAEPLTG